MRLSFCQVNNPVMEVLILKGLKLHQNCAILGVSWRGTGGESARYSGIADIGLKKNGGRSAGGLECGFT